MPLPGEFDAVVGDEEVPSRFAEGPKIHLFSAGLAPGPKADFAGGGKYGRLSNPRFPGCLPVDCSPVPFIGQIGNPNALPVVVARPLSLDRPLLQGDSVAALRALAEMRAPYYARADVAVQTVGRSVEEVAREVATLARSQGVW